MKKIYAFVIIWCYSLFAFSDPSIEGAELESKSNEYWYKIELLIFSQSERHNKTEEMWLLNQPLTYPSIWVTLVDPEEYIANPQRPPLLQKWLDGFTSSAMTPFIKLDKTKNSLLNSGKKGVGLPGKILWHNSWWQPFIKNDEREAIGVLIRSGDRYGDHYELEGFASFKLSRYLHVNINLWQSEFVERKLEPANSFWPARTSAENTIEDDFFLHLPPLPELNTSKTPDGSQVFLGAGMDSAENDHDPRVAGTDADTEVAFLDNRPYRVGRIVHMAEARRMRSNEIHYIDHPEFGILLRLTLLQE